jgi:hypothetical protein
MEFRLGSRASGTESLIHISVTIVFSESDWLRDEIRGQKKEGAL